MALAGAGLSNEEIAERLVVSPATARTHVSRAMVKLGARDRAQLVVFAYESGLVSPGHARLRYARRRSRPGRPAPDVQAPSRLPADDRPRPPAARSGDQPPAIPGGDPCRA